MPPTSAPIRIAAARGDDRERQRGARAVEQPGKDVAPEGVRAQQQQRAAAVVD